MILCTPIKNQIIVKLTDPEKEKNGILIPDIAIKENVFAVVEEIGDGIEDSSGNKIPLSVKQGDFVVIRSRKQGDVANSLPIGTPIFHKDEECFIIREEDILAIIEKD